MTTNLDDPDNCIFKEEYGCKEIRRYSKLTINEQLKALLQKLYPGTYYLLWIDQIDNSDYDLPATYRAMLGVYRHMYTPSISLVCMIDTTAWCTTAEAAEEQLKFKLAHFHAIDTAHRERELTWRRFVKQN